MIDRQKVIKALELCRDGRCDIRCPYNNIDFGCRKHLDTDAIGLLKEQPEIVRCIDCLWHEMRGEMLICKAENKPHTYDWFCAGGKRMDDDG